MEPMAIGAGGGLLAAAERRMGWLERRHEVLARNVANADTPGYVAQDLAPATPAIPPLTMTHPAHMAPRNAAPGVRTIATERAPDGNGVALDVQLARLAETELQHGFAAGAQRRFGAMLRSALGRTG